ncbi:MAG: hypothetical protein KGK00_04455 [Paracoccaceae bacterium]|nr:hypothetical protein [Paracoccaceae bacterium]
MRQVFDPTRTQHRVTIAAELTRRLTDVVRVSADFAAKVVGNAETAPGADHVTIAVSGARGGHTVDLRRLTDQGLVLLGRRAVVPAQSVPVARPWGRFLEVAAAACRIRRTTGPVPPLNGRSRPNPMPQCDIVAPVIQKCARKFQALAASGRLTNSFDGKMRGHGAQ